MTEGTRGSYGLRCSIVDIGRRLHAQGFISGSDGNISVRLGDKILVTPSGLPKDALRPADLVVVDLQGRPYGRGKPSSELRMHLSLYRLRPDISVAVHAHPPWVIAGSMQPGFRFDFTPEGIVALEGIHQVGYARPGTSRVAELLEPVLTLGKSFILTRHGSLTLGKNPEEAFRRLENLEHNAKIAMIALSAGSLTPLQESEVAVLTQRGYASEKTPGPTSSVRGQSLVRISDEEALVERLVSGNYSERTKR